MTSVSSSTSAYAYGDYQSRQKSLFSKLDSDQDGKLTQDEFVSGRPDDMAASQAQALYSKMDASGAGSISEADFTSSNYAPSQGPLAQMSSTMAIAVMSMQSSGAGTGDQKTAAEIYASMDADGDGTVTQSEFTAARPEDVSEEQANSLYASIDTSGAGSITLEQLEKSLSQRPSEGASTEESSSEGLATDLFSLLDADGDGKVTQDEFLSSLADTVDEDSAKALYDLIDTTGSGSFTQEQLSDVLEASRPAGPPPPPSGGLSGAGASDEDQSAAIYDALDVNQDGVVSQSEFLAAKPQDVSSEDAQSLYDSMDTTGTGSITQAQLADLLEQLESSISVG